MSINNLNVLLLVKKKQKTEAMVEQKLEEMLKILLKSRQKVKRGDHKRATSSGRGISNKEGNTRE